jgi:hypothetical protein
VTPRNTEYTKYDPPGVQVSDDALAQKYLLDIPLARLKLRYRYLRVYFFSPLKIRRTGSAGLAAKV